MAGRIREAVNGWLRDLVARAIDPAVDLAARSVLATPNLTAPGGRVRELWRLSAGLANAGYVLLVCAGGVLLMTNETLQARYTVKDVAPRLVVGMVASNTSLVLVSVGIDLANALSRALLGPGVDPAQAQATLKAVLVFPLDDANVLLTLVALVVVVLALILAASYVLRVAVLVGLMVAGPLALACHALPQTEALARWWWRGHHRLSGHPGRPVAGPDHARCGCSSTPTKTGSWASAGPGWSTCWSPSCLLWLLARIPAWATRMVLVGRPGTAVTVAKSYVAYRLVRRGLAPAPAMTPTDGRTPTLGWCGSRPTWTAPTGSWLASPARQLAILVAGAGWPPGP